MTFPRGSQAADGLIPCQTIIETKLPDSTIQEGDWVGTVHLRIDEIGNDAEFTTSNSFTTTNCGAPDVGTPFIVSIENPTGTPGDSDCQSIEVTFRCRMEEIMGSGTIDVTCELMQGASTVIDSRGVGITTTLTSFTFQTTVAEFNNITDHDDLRIRFTAEGCVDSGGDEVECEVMGVTVAYIAR